MRLLIALVDIWFALRCWKWNRSFAACLVGHAAFRGPLYSPYARWSTATSAIILALLAAAVAESVLDVFRLFTRREARLVAFASICCGAAIVLAVFGYQEQFNVRDVAFVRIREYSHAFLCGVAITVAGWALKHRDRQSSVKMLALIGMYTGIHTGFGLARPGSGQLELWRTINVLFLVSLIVILIAGSLLLVDRRPHSDAVRNHQDG